MQTSSNIIKLPSVVVRGAVVLLGSAALAPWLWAVASDAGGAASAGLPLRPDEALTAIVACAALAGVSWLALGVLLGLLSVVPGATGDAACRVADVVTPRLVRRAAGALLGVGIAAGITPGASVAAAPPVVLAAPAPLPDPGFAPLPDPAWAPPSPGPVAPVEQAEPDDRGGRWVPGPPVVREQPDVRVLSPGPRAGTTHEAPAEVVVRRGDSLWSIAARHLGHDASDAEVARTWPAWFEANRDVVGDDPDLLRPGQVLRAPEGVQP